MEEQSTMLTEWEFQEAQRLLRASTKSHREAVDSSMDIGDAGGDATHERRRMVQDSAMFHQRCADELDALLKTATVVKPEEQASVVRLGNVVFLEGALLGSFSVAGAIFSPKQPPTSTISVRSEVGRQLIGKVVGDTVTTPKGKKAKILKILPPSVYRNIFCCA